MKELVLATKNEGKVREIIAILNRLELSIKVLSLKDLPGAPDVVEDGATFYENASKKAQAIMEFSGLATLADDSGLEVDALGGAPGIYSSRFSGAGATDESNRVKLLRNLEGIPTESRKARFRCVVALSEPGKGILIAEGICRGEIGYEPQGNGGFGYDPIFILPQYGKTFAQISEELKNQISHRAMAIEELFRKYKAGLQE